MKSSAPETFVERWTRRKAEHASTATAPSPALTPLTKHTPSVTPAATATVAAHPTLVDVAGMVADADYSAFMARGLDRAVHHAAMKKLFAEPHFNVMDGLDIYIGDYTVASPVSPAMLAGLAHARSTLDPKPAWRTGEPGIDSHPSDALDVSDVSDVSDASDMAEVADGSAGAIAPDPQDATRTGEPGEKAVRAIEDIDAGSGQRVAEDDARPGTEARLPPSTVAQHCTHGAKA